MAEQKKKSGKMYAWSEIRNGGEVEVIPVAGGGTRNIVSKRNIAMPGDEVSQSDLNASDEDWEAWQEAGSVRSYPLPEGAVDSSESPAQIVLRQFLNREGEVDANAILELGLQNPPVAPTEEEVKEAAAPEGV